MEADTYVFIPFTVKATEGTPSGLFQLNESTAVAQVTTEPVCRWMKAAREFLERSPVRESDPRLDWYLAGTHALIVQHKALPRQGTERSMDYSLPPIEHVEVVSLPRMHLRLSPVIERSFAALVVSARLFLHYTAYFAIADNGDRAEVTQFGSVPWQVPGGFETGGPYELESLSDECLRRASKIHCSLGMCEGKHQRPVIALDTFYRGLLEGDWRIELILMVVALEALFGPPDRELSHQVCERAASFIAPPGAGRIGAYQDLKRLYTVRSKLVHGGFSSTDGRSRKQLRADLEFLEDTVRQCLRRLLVDGELARRFCGRPDDLNEFLESLVLGGPSPL